MAKRFFAWLLAIIGGLTIIGAFTAHKGILYGLACILIGGAFLAGAFFLIRNANQNGNGVIEKTKIIDAYGKTSTASAAGRSAVGGFVAGPIGAVVGASTAKQKRSTTFLVFYKDGKKSTITVQNDSLEYQKYIKYLDG